VASQGRTAGFRTVGRLSARRGAPLCGPPLATGTLALPLSPLGGIHGDELPAERRTGAGGGRTGLAKPRGQAHGHADQHNRHEPREGLAFTGGQRHVVAG
jgi:hypothetical protein